MGFPILVKYHLYIESGRWSLQTTLSSMPLIISPLSESCHYFAINNNPWNDLRWYFFFNIPDVSRTSVAFMLGCGIDGMINCSMMDMFGFIFILYRIRRVRWLVILMHFRLNTWLRNYFNSSFQITDLLGDLRVVSNFCKRVELRRDLKQDTWGISLHWFGPFGLTGNKNSLKYRDLRTFRKLKYFSKLAPRDTIFSATHFYNLFQHFFNKYFKFLCPDLSVII